MSVEMTLLEASVGDTIEVSFDAIDRCGHCHGNGAEPGTPIERCSRCDGVGQVQSVVRTPFGQMMRTSSATPAMAMDDSPPPHVASVAVAAGRRCGATSRLRFPRASPTGNASA